MPEDALANLDTLMQSQIALLQALQVNQASMLDKIERLVRPVEEQVRELRTTVDAMSRQIDQMHERQEQLERTMMMPLRRTSDLASQGEP